MKGVLLPFPLLHEGVYVKLAQAKWDESGQYGNMAQQGAFIEATIVTCHMAAYRHQVSICLQVMLLQHTQMPIPCKLFAHERGRHAVCILAVLMMGMMLLQAHGVKREVVLNPILVKQLLPILPYALGAITCSGMHLMAALPDPGGS